MSTKALVCLLLLIPLLAGAAMLARAAAPHSSMVPNESVFGCNTCHYGGDFSDPPRTPGFRADFAANDHRWDATLAGLDSDGDGFTNGQELGDPDGTWQPGDPDPAGTRRQGEGETRRPTSCKPSLLPKVSFSLCPPFSLSQAASLAVSNPSDPLSTPGQPADPLVARGKYLVDGIGACGNCHTPLRPDGAPDLSRYLAGGRVWDEAFGRVYAANITPDPETGIGSWTDAQIARAIREGIRPDGTVLFPLMPYKLYRNMSDDDVAAVVAYLRTVPAVRNAVPPRELAVPEPPAPPPITDPVPGPPITDTLAVGEYLATAVGDCVLCHTPLVSPYLDLDETRLFAGGNPFPGPWGTVYSTNLTPHPTGLGDKSDAELIARIRYGRTGDDRRLLPPMGYSFYGALTDQDLRAIVAYLRSLDPVSNTIPAPELNPIRGRVVDQDSHPISGAVISLRATGITTTTASDGTFLFRISNVELQNEQAATPTPKSEIRFTGLLTAWKPGYYIAQRGVLPGDADVLLTLRPYPTGDNPDYSWIFPHRADSPPEVDFGCDTCHADVIVAQWKANAHARSARSLRFLSLYNGTDVTGTRVVPPGYLLDFPGTAGNCATCHAPGAAVDAPFTTDMNTLTSPESDGVFCDFCHKVGGVYLNPATGLPYPNMPGVLSMDLRRPPEGQQMFFGPYPDVPEPDTYLPLMQQSQFCAPCHTFSFWGTPIYQSFPEWLASPYAEEGVQCQDCHMQPDPAVTHFAAPEKGGFARDPMTIPSHKQPGAADVELLRNTVDMSLAATQVGNRVQVTVVITNTGAGHHVPTGNPARHMILTVTAADAEGRALPLRSGPTVPDWGGAYAGQPGKGYAKVLRDVATGEAPVASYWKQTLIESDNRIPALVADTSTYEFQAPARGGAIEVEVKLIFRRAFKSLADLKGWNISDIVMEETTQSISPRPAFRVYLPLVLKTS